jgi:hypothetical protein
MSALTTPNDTPRSERTGVWQIDKDLSQQDLVSAEKKLSELIEKRGNLVKHLVGNSHQNSIENSLYNLETSYIEEVTYGNIIRGYEGYLTARTPTGRRHRPMEADRIFSNSSASFHRVKLPDQAVEREMTPGYDSPDPADGDGDYMSSDKSRRKKKSEPSSRKKRVVQSDED